MAEFHVQVSTADFNAHTEIQRLSIPGTGGINTFVGVVRDNNDQSDVRCLRLEHYPGMTEKQILAIMEEAAQRFEVLSATVIHRVGDLYPGDQIVFVGVASPHRGDAFDAAEFIIDFLKTRATFWKKEFTPDGPRWLTTRTTDVETAANWQSETAS
ncbi:MAG: molybdenum cofactor biosynthesis protein MoaE [Pseudomonadales bacterium]